jgi:xylose isomerase
LNSQPLGNYDQDLNVGVVSWQDTEALLYALKAIGYKEHLGIDINPEHMPVLEAIKVNARVLQIMNERVDAMPHEKLLECFYHPDKHRGGIEMLLAESYAKKK